MADQAFQLVVRRGPRPGQIFPLSLQTVTLGRDPLSDIVINDPEVSRHHARFTRGPAGYEVQDMGSTNGTFVDGKRLTGDPVALQPAQLLMFGSNVTLVYQVTSEADPMATMVGPAAMQAPEVPEPEPVSEEPELPAEPEPVEVEPEPVVEPMVEEPADELEPPEAPAEVVEELPQIEDVVEEEPGLATIMEGPMAVDEVSVEPEPLPTFDEPDIQTEPPVTFEPEEPVEKPPPAPEMPAPVPSFEQPEPKPVVDSGEPLPDFEPAPAEVPPVEPAAPMPPDDGSKDNKIGGIDRNIVIALVVIVLICCCCLLVVGAVLSLQPDAIFDLLNI